MKQRIFMGMVCSVFICVASFADLSQFGPATGYMNVFNNDGGSQGAYAFGSSWGVSDLQAITSDDQTFELLPNINTYNDNPGDAFWRNNDGAGPDGNKWMEALVYREHTLLAGETAATMEYSVSAYDLDARYTVQAFVKTLDPGAGYSTTYSDYALISGAAGPVSLNIDTTGMDGQILQYGFVMNGLNANPATDWGSATVTMDSLNVIPEPASIVLLALAGGGVLFFRRNFKI